MTRFLLLSIACLALCSHSNAQSLKVYSGKYKDGKATYTYKDNPEGGRIYEGDFIYTGSSQMGFIYKATGKFKNNQKHGSWTYIQATNKILKVIYKNGILEGPYQYTSPSESLSLTIKDGKFVGAAKGTGISYHWGIRVKGEGDEYYYFDSSKVSFSGQFDDNGHFDGQWTFKEEDSEIVYHAIYEHGICKKYYREDLTTGDIRLGKGKIDLNEAVRSKLKSAEEMVNRGYSKWEEGNLEVEEPEPVKQKIIKQEKSEPTPPQTVYTTIYARRAIIGKLPTLIYNGTEEGTVEVHITINTDGDIIKLGIDKYRTNTKSKTLWTIAKEATAKLKFKKGGYQDEYGSVKYIFKKNPTNQSNKN